MKKVFIISLLFFSACATPETTSTTVAETTTTTTVAETTTTTTVAGVVSPFIDDEKIRLFPASDLPQSTIDLTLQYTNEAYDLWMADDYYGKSQAKAIYIMITGSDMEAGKNANREYCNHLTSTGFPSADWCRLDTYKDYVNNGGGGINSSAVDGFYFMVMAPQDNEIDNGYKTMTYHEVFHIYQMSNIFTTEYEAVDEYMGKRSGDNGEDVAWWSEGNADFFSALYTYDLEGFKNEMRWALEGGPWPVDRKTQFFQDGIKLYNISWNSGQGVDLGYRIGSWFTAYLVHNHGEESVYTLWNTVNEKGFDQTFIDVYGKDHRTYINEFETWLQQPNDELLKILDGIYSSKVKNQN